MTWVNTVDGDLLNLDNAIQIKMYEVEYDEKSIGVMVYAVFNEDKEIFLTCCDGHDGFDEMFHKLICRQFTTLTYSFKEMCKTNIPAIVKISKEMDEKLKEADGKEFHDIYKKYDSKIDKELEIISKNISKIECAMDLCDF